MPLLTAVSTSYRSGEIVAVIALAILLVALLHRIVKRRGQIAATVATADVAAAPAPAAAGGSVAPPGWAATPAGGTGPQRALLRDAVAAVIVLALLVLGVVKIAESSTHSSVNGAVPASSAPASPAPVAWPPGSPAPLT